MLNLILEHWLELISLVVALIGGVPGMVAILTEWKARPKLAAYIHHIMPFQSNDVGGESVSGLILHVAVGNKGKEPLVPLAFQLECKIDRRWVSFEAGKIPEGFIVNGPNWQHKYTNVAENDIQRRQSSISRESPVYGFFSFVSKDVDFGELNSIYRRIPIKLKCTDLFGRVYELILNKDLKPTTRIHPSSPPGRGVEVSVTPESSA